MADSHDTFTLFVSPTEAIERCRAALDGKRAKIVRADADEIVIKFTPSWKRNPASMVIRFRPVENAGTENAEVEVVLHGNIRGRLSRQKAYLAEDMRMVREAMEIGSSPSGEVMNG